MLTAAEIADQFLDGDERHELERAILRHMEHHMKRAAEAEREACAQIANEAGACMLQDFGLQSALQANADAIAVAIRRRANPSQ